MVAEDEMTAGVQRSWLAMRLSWAIVGGPISTWKTSEITWVQPWMK